MLPIFIGLAVWITLLALLVAGVVLAFRPLRRFVGFVLLTPLMGIGGALFGFVAIGWLLNGRLRPELAVSLAFYLGFLLCGAVGSFAGLTGGFYIWFRMRPKAEPTQ